MLANEKNKQQNYVLHFTKIKKSNVAALIFMYIKTKKTYPHCLRVVKKSHRRKPTMGKQSSDNQKSRLKRRLEHAKNHH